MPIIKRGCPECGKTLEIVESFDLAGISYKKYKCGHYVIGDKMKEVSYDFTSADGHRPYKYQLDGAKFIAEADGRAGVLDEMGLGKTIQFLLFLRAHQDEALKYLVVCKSGLRIQWLKAALNWLPDKLMPQVIESEMDFVLPGIKGFIVSMDLLRRFKNLEDWLLRLGIKTVCLDECQAFKNGSSKRTNAVRTICKNVPYVIALSGTPIKNNAAEYFPILNILKPEVFPSEQRYLQTDVDSYFDGYKMKVGGLKNPDQFFNKTKGFLIRRTRNQVLPDLPNCTRGFRFAELGDEVEKAYRDTFKQFQDYYLYGSQGDSAFLKTSNLMAYLSKMRHLTGLAKIEPCCDFVDEFIMTTDRKITIFVHHKDVGRAILNRLRDARNQFPAEYGPEILELNADMNSVQRDEVVQKFWTDGYRVLIASTLASGEGLNLQCGSDCIMLERQWNPANEEQAESRFIRIGQKSNKVNATYFVAVGTVDEFLAELVEKKREICAQTLDGKEMKWEESSIIRELTEVLAVKGGAKWGW